VLSDSFQNRSFVQRPSERVERCHDIDEITDVDNCNKILGMFNVVLKRVGTQRSLAYALVATVVAAISAIMIGCIYTARRRMMLRSGFPSYKKALLALNVTVVVLTSCSMVRRHLEDFPRCHHRAMMEQFFIEECAASSSGGSGTATYTWSV